MKNTIFKIGQKVKFNKQSIEKTNKISKDPKMIKIYGKERIANLIKNSLKTYIIKNVSMDNTGNPIIFLINHKGGTLPSQLELV